MKESIRNKKHQTRVFFLKNKGWLVLVMSLALVPLLRVPAGGEELTLERALNIALQNSPTMRQVGFQLEISERNLMAQQAGLKSQFSLTLMPYRTSSSRVFNDLTSDYNTQTQTRTQTTFTIRQPIKWTDATLTVTDRLNWQEATSSFAGGTKQSAFSNTLTFSLNQPLFTYNRTKMQIKELELAIELILEPVLHRLAQFFLSRRGEVFGVRLQYRSAFTHQFAGVGEESAVLCVRGGPGKVARGRLCQASLFEDRRFSAHIRSSIRGRAVD